MSEVAERGAQSIEAGAGEDKRRFVRLIAEANAIREAFQTRGKPIYREGVDSDQRTELREQLRKHLRKLKSKIRRSRKKIIDKGDLRSIIESTAQQLTESFASILHEQRFRIGIAQKAVNLYLKYLWMFREIQEPPYCTIDSIVKRAIENELKSGKPLDSSLGSGLINWTELDRLDQFDEYMTAIARIRADKTIAEWELAVWNGTTGLIRNPAHSSSTWTF